VTFTADTVGEIAGGVPVRCVRLVETRYEQPGPARHLAGHRLKDGRNANGTRRFEAEMVVAGESSERQSISLTRSSMS